MNDLLVPPGPGIPHGLVIPAGELVERFARSSGAMAVTSSPLR